jgi:membrane-bound lytic murein transglycosylase B
MTDSNPWHELDDAIHAYAKFLGHDGTVSGWTLAFQTSLIEATSPQLQPLGHTYGYGLGPGTSPALAVGLTQALTAVIQGHLVDNMAAGDDPEDSE